MSNHKFTLILDDKDWELLKDLEISVTRKMGSLTSVSDILRSFIRYANGKEIGLMSIALFRDNSVSSVEELED